MTSILLTGCSFESPLLSGSMPVIEKSKILEKILCENLISRSRVKEQTALAVIPIYSLAG